MPLTGLSSAEICLEQMLERMTAIAMRIHQSSNLSDIWHLVLREIKEMLVSDRVVIYRFLPGGDGVVAEESVSPEWTPIQGQLIYDPCFNAKWVEQYQQGKISILEDIDAKPLQPCYRELLTRLQIRANLVVPILVHNQGNPSVSASSSQLWGLLIAHQCSSPRHWQPVEIKFLQQVAAQLGIALQQKELYQQWQQLNQQHLETQAKQQSHAFRQTETFLRQHDADCTCTETAVADSISSENLKIFDRLQTPIWIFDLEKLKMWWANKAALYIWNAQSTDELLGRNFSDISEATQIRLSSYLHQFEQGKTIAENWTFYPDGKPVSVRCLCSGIQIEEGRMAMLVEATTEAINQIDQETLRSIEAMRHTTLMISLYTMDGVALIQNPAALNCYGDTLYPNTANENTFLRHFVEPKIGQQAMAVIGSGEVFSIETQVFTRQGIRWHGLDIRCTRDPVTGDRMILVNERDITRRQQALEERKQAETQLRSKEALLRCMTDTSLLAFYVVDNRTDKILYFNHRFCEIWGIEHLEDQLRLGTIKNNDIIPDCVALIADVPAFAESCKPLQSEDNRATVEDEIRFVDGRIIRRFSSQIRDGFDCYFGRLYIFEDISDRKQLEKSLRLTDFSMECLAISAIWSDKNANILRVNEAACRNLGYDRAELNSMRVYDIDENFSPENWAERWQELKQQKHINFISQNKRKNGHFFVGELTTNYVEFDGEEYACTFLQDISDRIQAEAKLREIEARWQYALEGNGDGVWDWNLQSNTVFFSRRWKEMLGFAESEISNTLNEWETRVHPDDKAGVYQQIEKHFRGETEQYISEHRVKCKDGTYKWILDRGKALTYTEDGRPLRMIGTHTDITERKLMEEALRESEERYRSVIAALAEGIVLQQADGKITTCNERAEEILGLTTDQMIGRTSLDPCWRSIHEDGSPFPGETHPAMVTLRTGKPQFNVVMGVHKPDGILTWVEINSQALFYCDQSQPYAVVTSFADITIRKQAEQALRQQMERERMVYAIAQNIRQSLDLEQILNTTVAEVRHFLQTDRVIIYRFNEDWSGVVVKESLAEGWRSILNMEITDTYFVERQGKFYQPFTIAVTPNIYTAGLDPCHLELLERLQVRAKIVVPILQGDYLWGLLVVHNCSAPRDWYGWEITLLNQLATQLAIAIHQSELHQQLHLVNQKLHQLATIDQLTQIPNRRSFDEKINQEWDHLLREQNPLSLLICDIDYFKQYNDTYGHAAGDTCLTMVAQALKQSVQRCTDLVARYGGEEFAAILPNTDSDGAMEVAQKIQQAIEQLHIPHSGSAVKEFVTLSIGIATVIPTSGIVPLDLIEVADRTLYQAKSQGRNRSLMTNLSRHNPSY